MKKLLFILLAGTFGLAASAQEKEKSTDHKVKAENHTSMTKVKKTSTPKQKVHNVIHPKRKHYNGVKVKHEKKD